MNGVYRTPDYRLFPLAEQACPWVLVDNDVDAQDPDAITKPLMYEAGVYFICDVTLDSRTNVYRIPFSKTFDELLLARAYEKGTVNDLRHALGVGEVATGNRKPNVERTGNRTSNHTLDVRSLRPPERPLPIVGQRLNGLPLPAAPRPRGPDVDYFNRRGGGNRDAVMLELDIQQDPNNGNPLKNEVQVILEQMFFDILQESPNKRTHTEGSWTNIPHMLREEYGVENLYQRLDLPFHAVQYAILSPEKWLLHFNRFFPPTIPKHAGQNFGKASYYHSYLNLVRTLSQQRLTQVRAELFGKFNTLAWVPHTESDRMWCTKKALTRNWSSLPPGIVQGPKVAINSIVMARLGERPRLRPAPQPDQPRVQAEEEEEEEGGEEQ